MYRCTYTQHDMCGTVHYTHNVLIICMHISYVSEPAANSGYPNLRSPYDMNHQVSLNMAQTWLAFYDSK